MTDHFCNLFSKNKCSKHTRWQSRHHGRQRLFRLKERKWLVSPSQKMRRNPNCFKVKIVISEISSTCISFIVQVQQATTPPDLLSPDEWKWEKSMSPPSSLRNGRCHQNCNISIFHSRKIKRMPIVRNISFPVMAYRFDAAKRFHGFSKFPPQICQLHRNCGYVAAADSKSWSEKRNSTTPSCTRTNEDRSFESWHRQQFHKFSVALLQHLQIH